MINWVNIVSVVASVVKTVLQYLNNKKIKEQTINELIVENYKKEKAKRHEIDKLVKKIDSMSADDISDLLRKQRRYAK